MLLQLERLTSSLPWAPTIAGSETLTRSDFLGNAQPKFDADHYGLEKVKRRLMEYLAAIRLRVLIAQEAKIEQAKVQEVTLKKAIDELAVGSNEIDNQSENAHRTLIKAGEIPPPARVPVFLHHPSRKAYQRQNPSRPPIYSEFRHHLALVIWMM